MLAEKEAPVREPAAPPGQRFAHLRSLDGLRGLAVVLVVLSHFAPGEAPGGFLGVDLFFVLSGFLITSLLVSEWEATDRVSLGNFWLRRARRLYPALVVMVGVVLAYTVLTQSRFEARNVAIDGLSALFYVANWRFISSGQSYILQFIQRAPSPLRHTWSLAIEEQFYLCWPLVVLLVTRLTRRSRRGLRPAMVAVSVVLGVVSFGWMVALYHHGANLDRLYYGTDTRVFMILAGAALGAATAGRPFLTGRLERARPLLVAVGLLGVAGLLAATVWLTTSSQWLYAGGYGLIALVLVVILLAAAQPGANPLARAFETRPLVGLGLISYGIYLWHWPIALWVTKENTQIDGPTLFLVRCALTLSISIISYYVVEQPIRCGWLPNLKGHGRRLVAPLVVGALVVLLLIPTYAFPTALAPPTTRAIGPTKATLTAYGAAPRCDGPAGTSAVEPGKRVVVQLEGNSLAAEVHNCLSQILETRGASIEETKDPKFLICRDTPKIEDEALRYHVVAAVLFVFVAYNPNCGSPWHGPIDRLVEFYEAHHIHVYLVASVPIVKGGRDDLARGPLLEQAYYRQLAARDPEHITALDAGTFLRNDQGTYEWRMPCLGRAEPGCSTNDTVGVRFTDGLHYCTDPNFAAHGCQGAENQAGERRVSAAIAAGLIPSLTRVLAAR